MDLTKKLKEEMRKHFLQQIKSVHSEIKKLWYTVEKYKPMKHYNYIYSTMNNMHYMLL